MSRKTRARWARDIRPLFTVYLPVLPYILFALFPLYFMLVTSLKSNAELYDVNAVPFWITHGLTADHYRLLSTDTPFWSWFPNNVTLTGGGPGEPHPRQRVRGEQAQDVWKLDLERQ